MTAHILLLKLALSQIAVLKDLLETPSNPLKTVDSVEQLEAHLRDHPPMIVVTDSEQLTRLDIERCNTASQRHPSLQFVVLSVGINGKYGKHLPDIFRAEFVTNLIAKDTHRFASDVVTTMKKLEQNDLFGLCKYLAPATSPQVHSVTSSNDKSALIEALAQFGKQLDINGRLLNLALGAADEFITNAVYNAPVDSSGSRLYAQIQRSQPVHLAPSEYSTFSYASNDKHLAISVSDPFGSLKLETIRKYLLKCFTLENPIGSKTAGAGMGLYLALNSLSQLVINVDPGKRTEIIGLIDLTRSYRKFASQPKSLHLFTKH